MAPDPLGPCVVGFHFSRLILQRKEIERGPRIPWKPKELAIQTGATRLGTGPSPLAVTGRKITTSEGRAKLLPL